MGVVVLRGVFIRNKNEEKNWKAGSLIRKNNIMHDFDERWGLYVGKGGGGMGLSNFGGKTNTD